jgi:hypothetical protein
MHLWSAPASPSIDQDVVKRPKRCLSFSQKVVKTTVIWEMSGKQSGIGRENHRMMLDHYQQMKNMLVSYSPKPVGFF